MSAARVLALAIAIAIAQAVTPSRARADTTTDACIAAYEGGQLLRRDGKLRRAKDKLTFCASTSCPAETSGDCARWLREVEESLPTMVVRAYDEAGRDAVDVRTSLDGEMVAARADGRAIAVDPGPHDLLFERDGVAPIRQTVILREGEKDRAVTVRWSRRAEGESRAPVPASAVVLGAVGAVAFASFAVLGTKGYLDAQSLKGSCVPHCATSDVDSVNHELRAADVSLGVAVVALGVAAFLWLSHREAVPTTALTF